jgi:glycosyltransferase involved in cell wall biosynthesis
MWQMKASIFRQQLSNIYQQLYTLTTMGKLSPWLKPIHTSLIALELAAQRSLDKVLPHEATTPILNEKVTLLVKTFMRPTIIQRLVTSIRNFYPHVPIIVVDDSQSPQTIPGVDTIFLAYDSGISVGRAEGLRHVHTPYVLLLDDDCVFYRHTRLGHALELMEQFPMIDIMGGAVVNLPFFIAADYAKAGLYHKQTEPTFPPDTRIGHMPVMDKVANFFLARTERLRLVEWDPILKLLEHADFFTRARGVLTTVYNQDLRCLHARTPFDKEYMAYRDNYLPYVVYLRRKYKLDEFSEDADGR